MTAAAPAGSRSGVTPFYFNTDAHLLRITSYKANDVSQLLVGLQKCPDDSIFQHSFRTLLEHHFIREGFTNDFAHWAASACKEPKLAEALAQVDVRNFASVPEIRTRFVEIVQAFLKASRKVGAKAARQAFYFCASDVVVIPTQYMARTLIEFAEGLRSVSVHSIHHHFIEARLRLNLKSNDFSVWLEDIGLPEAAEQLKKIDIYSVTLEDAREQILRSVKRALT